MKIFPISHGLSFTSNLEEMNGNKSMVTMYANNIIRNQEPLLINNISNNVYDTFTRINNEKIKNIEKFSIPFNKAKMLKNIAQLMYNAEKYEDAGIILGESFKILKDNLGVWENDKQNLLSDKTNLQILKTFYNTSNNIKAKYNVIKNIKDLNNPIFLPIAEAICNCDDEIVTPNDKQTIFQAREILRKYYDLNLLEKFINKDDNYKIGVLKVLSKWGTQANIDLAKKLETDKNLQIASLAKKTVIKLRDANKYTDLNIDNTSNNPFTINQNFQYVLNEYLKGNYSCLRDIKYSASNQNIKALRTAIENAKDDDKKNNLKFVLANVSDKDFDLSLVEKTDNINNIQMQRYLIEAYLKMYVRNKRKDNTL